MSADLQHGRPAEERPPVRTRDGDIISISQSWHGPLPPPDHLHAYNQVFPGCAERIVAMAEAENEHRRNLDRHDADSDRLLITGEIASEKLGMYLGFALAVLIIGVSAFLLYAGRLAWGISLVSIELISLVALFIYGRRRMYVRSNDQPDQAPAQSSLPFPQ